MPTATSERRVCAVIPCYNVAQLCAPVVRTTAHYADWVIVVDDGSTDDTRRVLDAVAADCPNVQVLAHTENQGKGVALLRGMRHALAHIPFDTLITLDGDAQHRPDDIPRLVDLLQTDAADLVIGQRVAFEAMPLRSRLGNEITGKLFQWIYPDAPRDTQCGFRAFSHEFSSRIVDVIRGERYETELNILLYALECGHPVSSAPIPTVYLNGNRSSHFKPVLDSMRILRALFRWWWLRMWRDWTEKLKET
jgi:glycosyltransferase involved in cell wall biosynthesis